jgi:hypothetical protein
MHRQGAEFTADDCLTRSIVSEVTEGTRDGDDSGLETGE